MTPMVPGSLFQAQTVDPEADSDESDCEVDSAPHTLVTEDGDVSCIFTFNPFNAMATEPLKVQQLMRPMHPDSVNILVKKGLMRKALRSKEPLSDTVPTMNRALQSWLEKAAPGLRKARQQKRRQRQ